ncbi:MAG: hypothetical protein HY537_16140 [Deltaproteobacteria bacterium]|nr:hypothetical protein [Deltaproteobacteria bacterium]
MVNLLTMVALLVSSVFADHARNVPRATSHVPPKYQVNVREQDSLEILSRLDEAAFYSEYPYAKIRPEPFYYQKDWEKDGKKTFLIAGVNCDSIINGAQSITGVSMKYLDERAHAPELYDPSEKGVYPYISTPRNSIKFPARWKDSWNVGFRASSDGFITKRQTLKDVLLEDNKQVQKMGLNHQKLAEPILMAIEELYRMPGKRGRPESFSFYFGGQTYTVNVGPMLPGTWHDVEPPTGENERRRYNYESNIPQTGWVGAGVQGSFFNDELFTDLVLTFTRNSDNKKLTIDGLTPHLIYRYGFYQGGQYRIAPLEIAQFFLLKAGLGNSGFEKCKKG